MDFNFWGGLILSLMIFAPGCLILGLSAVIGLIMLLDRPGKSCLEPVKLVQSSPGDVVNALKESLETKKESLEINQSKRKVG